jgi:hypothetical protein
MGGRGASSGISNKGKPYGSEYTTVYQSGNIKFVKPNEGSTTAPMETMSKNRIYVTLDSKNKPKHITYYDRENKRVKQIDLFPPHKKMSPHTHHGYEHNERDDVFGATNPTAAEKKIIEKIKRKWYHHNSKS